MAHIEHIDPNHPLRPNTDFVPIGEVTQRYKLLGNNATKLLVEHLQLQGEVLIDPLTGLANEQAFDVTFDRLQEREAHSGRVDGEESNIGLIEIDIDGFKGVNDHFGHAKGNDLLKLIGATLQNSLRDSDMPVFVGHGSNDEDENEPKAGRRHGDELYILIPDLEANTKVSMTKQERMEAVKQRLRTAVTTAIGGTPENGKLFELGLGISMGSAIYLHGETKESFINRGDEAMYIDKEGKEIRSGAAKAAHKAAQ